MKHLFENTLLKEKDRRQNHQQVKLIQILSKSSSPLTVYDFSKGLEMSIPTCARLINDLVEEGIVVTQGKRETESGRRPLLYSLNKINLFSVGVEILLKKVTVGIVDFSLGVNYYKQKKDFVLEDTQDCLDEVISFVEESILNSEISHEKLLGMGVGLTGRVNIETGESLSYFTFLDCSLAEYMSNKFDLPVFLNNDTRCYGQAEKIVGKAKDVKNAIVINLSRGLGTTLIINDAIVNGGHGYAGELGHMQFGDSDKMCICGKRGCLGNDVSGFALEEAFNDAVSRGGLSLLTDVQKGENIAYDDILESALKGDSLPIQLIQELGVKLGKALGNIINLLNTELIIIGGKFSKLRGLLGGSIKAGMINTALVNPLADCEIEFSELGELAGLKGAGLLVYEHYKLI